MSDTLRTIIFQELRARYPDVDWTLGSTIRELVAEPVAELGDIASQYIAEAESRLDILKMLDNPTQYADAINDLAKKLGIVSPETVSATGTVRILLDSVPSVLVIAKGTQFTWGTVRLTTTAETRWSYGTNLTDGVSSLVMLGPATYQAEVEVVSNETGELALASGAPVNWLNAPRYVYDCRIGSAVTGGRVSYTLTEKAEMIRDIMFPASYNGALGIKTSLRRAMPLVVRDVVVGDKPTNKPGTVSLYVQTMRAPEQWSVTGTAKQIGTGIGLQLSLPGVYKITDVYDDVNAEATFSASVDGSTWTIMLPNETEAGGSFSISCEGFEDYSDVQTLLYNESKNTPYTFTLDTPTVAVISLDLVLSASREVTASSAAVVALQRYISSLPMNTYMLDDVTIERVLSPYGISLGASTLYTATIITATETRTRVNAGSINLQDIMYASSKPVIMYCFNDGMTITNV